MTDPKAPFVKKRHRRWDAELAKMCVFAVICPYPLTGLTTLYTCAVTNCLEQPHYTGDGSYHIHMVVLLSMMTLLIISVFLLALTRIAIGRRRFYATLGWLERKAQSIFTRQRPAQSSQS